MRLPETKGIKNEVGRLDQALETLGTPEAEGHRGEVSLRLRACATSEKEVARWKLEAPAARTRVQDSNRQLNQLLEAAPVVARICEPCLAGLPAPADFEQGRSLLIRELVERLSGGGPVAAGMAETLTRLSRQHQQDQATALEVEARREEATVKFSTAVIDLENSVKRARLFVQSHAPRGSRALELLKRPRAEVASKPAETPARKDDEEKPVPPEP